MNSSIKVLERILNLTRISRLTCYPGHLEKILHTLSLRGCAWEEKGVRRHLVPQHVYEQPDVAMCMRLVEAE